MSDIVEELCATPCNREPFTPSHAECQCLVANKAAYEIQRLRDALVTIARREAPGSADYDWAEVDYARDVLATANTAANTPDAATDKTDATS